jgi:hypothetical protein
MTQVESVREEVAVTLAAPASSPPTRLRAPEIVRRMLAPATVVELR